MTQKRRSRPAVRGAAGLHRPEEPGLVGTNERRRHRQVGHLGKGFGEDFEDLAPAIFRQRLERLATGVEAFGGKAVGHQHDMAVAGDVVIVEDAAGGVDADRGVIDEGPGRGEPFGMAGDQLRLPAVKQDAVLLRDPCGPAWLAGAEGMSAYADRPPFVKCGQVGHHHAAHTGPADDMGVALVIEHRVADRQVFDSDVAVGRGNQRSGTETDRGEDLVRGVGQADMEQERIADRAGLAIGIMEEDLATGLEDHDLDGGAGGDQHACQFDTRCGRAAADIGQRLVVVEGGGVIFRQGSVIVGDGAGLFVPEIGEHEVRAR